ncbi:MAG: effector binding domain-containing protein [Bacteroidota bacterium]
MEKPRLSRLTSILTQLQSSKIVTAQMLARKHGVSVRTIYRDIRTLEKSGIPVITEVGIGYSMIDGYKLPPVMFTEDEANALITAEQLILKNKDASFVEHYKEAILKIKAILKGPQKEKIDLLKNRIYFTANYTNQTTSNYLMRIQTAITDFRVLKIEYLSLNQIHTKRAIEPFALYSTQENWILIAYCRLREEFRAFRIDHIQNITFTAEHFESHDMTLEEYYKKYSEKYRTTPDIPLSQSAITFGHNVKPKTMEHTKKNEFMVVGITTRTSNENDRAATDIPTLWNRFMSENIANRVPNKVNGTVYALYTDYEGDHTQPYSLTIGCEVSSLNNIPEDMTVKMVPTATYAKFISKGNLTKDAVIDTWREIWSTDLQRAYTTDIEIYGEKAIDPTNGEAEILVAIASF